MGQRVLMGQYRGLLNTDEPRAPWQWEPRARRYRGPRGRWVGVHTMRELKEQFVDAQKVKMDKLVRRLAAGDMTRREWVLASREVVKGTYVDLYALSRGGRGAMTQSDYGKLGAMLKTQYQYLREFEAALRDGKLTPAAAAYRAKQYISSARRAFCEGERGAAQGAGLDEERRVLHPAEHCPDCIAYAARGWQPLGTLPQIGESQCRVNCRCTFVFRSRPA